MPHHDRLRAITTDASNSPFSEGILECEFLKKFTISTFDLYSDQKKSGPSSPPILGQDGNLYPERPYLVSDLLLQFEESSFQLVLLSSARSIHNFEDLTKLSLSKLLPPKV